MQLSPVRSSEQSNGLRSLRTKGCKRVSPSVHDITATHFPQNLYSRFLDYILLSTAPVNLIPCFHQRTLRFTKQNRGTLPMVCGTEFGYLEFYEGMLALRNRSRC